MSHPEVDAFLDYLWRYIALPESPEAFRHWEAERPPLVETGLGWDLPPGFEGVLAARGVPEAEFRQAVTCTAEVLFGSTYAASDEAGSRRFVEDLAALVGRVGVTVLDLGPYSGSRWADGNGWGARPSAEELAAWRDPQMPDQAGSEPGIWMDEIPES